LGSTREKKMEKPITRRLRGELRSTNWRLERPTAVIMPNMTQKMPPMMGVGTVRKRAPTLLTTPNRMSMSAAYWITRRLPTFEGKKYGEIKRIKAKVVIEDLIGVVTPPSKRLDFLQSHFFTPLPCMVL
jgi:hypothetical protein